MKAQTNPKDDGQRNEESLRGFLLEQPAKPLCPVASMEKYLSLLPPNLSAFQLHPKRTDYTGDLWKVNDVTPASLVSFVFFLLTLGALESPWG